MPSAGKLAVDVTSRLRRPWYPERFLQRIARRVARAEGFCSGRLSVLVVGRRAMRTLNERYLDLCEPTDVLAFDLGTVRRRGHLDGQIVICADVALRQARRSHTAANAELALYLTHGILHLAGYDDRTSAASRRMHAREDKLLTELGLGPVFQRGT